MVNINIDLFNWLFYNISIQSLAAYTTSLKEKKINKLLGQFYTLPF